MSRPLLGLILINHDSFGKVQENLCSQQPQEKQAQLSKVKNLYLSGHIIHYSDTRGRNLMKLFGFIEFALKWCNVIFSTSASDSEPEMRQFWIPSSWKQLTSGLRFETEVGNMALHQLRVKYKNPKSFIKIGPRKSE